MQESGVRNLELENGFADFRVAGGCDSLPFVLDSSAASLFCCGRALHPVTPELLNFCNAISRRGY